MNIDNTPIKPIETSIRGKLEAAFKPLHCNVINESYMHNVPKNSETHFKVIVVSERFNKESLIKRHRMINELLQEELQGGVHALSIIVSAEWQRHRNNGKLVIKQWLRVLFAEAVLGSNIIHCLKNYLRIIT